MVQILTLGANHPGSPDRERSQWTRGSTDQPVELLSIYPTLIDLCGLSENPKLEGVSLKPLLKNPDMKWNHVAISTLGQNNHAIRDQRWKNLAKQRVEPLHQKVINRLKTHLPQINLPQRGD